MIKSPPPRSLRPNQLIRLFFTYFTYILFLNLFYSDYHFPAFVSILISKEIIVKNQSKIHQIPYRTLTSCRLIFILSIQFHPISSQIIRFLIYIRINVVFVWPWSYDGLKKNSRPNAPTSLRIIFVKFYHPPYDTYYSHSDSNRIVPFAYKLHWWFVIYSP